MAKTPHIFSAKDDCFLLLFVVKCMLVLNNLLLFVVKCMLVLNNKVLQMFSIYIVEDAL